MTSITKRQSLLRICLACITILAGTLLCACPANQQRTITMTQQRINELRAEPGWPADKSIIIERGEGEDRIVRDPLDRDNPYRREYHEWDMWCYRNLLDKDNYQRYLESGELDEDLPAGHIELQAKIDEEGWLIPRKHYLLKDLDRPTGQHDPFASRADDKAYTCSRGVMADELLANMLAWQGRLKAPYLWDVPEWLLAEPVLYCIKLDDDLYLVNTNPNAPDPGTATFQYRDGMWQEHDNQWRLYDSTGTLQGEYSAGEEWWWMTLSKVAELADYSPEVLVVFYHSGCFEVYLDREHLVSSGDNFLGNFSYTGTKLTDAQLCKIDDDPRNSIELYGPEMAAAYEEQATCARIEPYGLSIGSKRPDKLDRFWPIAHGYWHGPVPTRYISIKPHADPDNPYYLDYGTWDLMAYNSMEQFCLDGYGNDYIFNDDSICPPLDAREIADDLGWTVNDINYMELTLRVDDEGYPVPALQSFRLDECPYDRVSEETRELAKRTRINFERETVFTISEEDEAQFRRAKSMISAEYLPLIHGELAANPPRRVLFLPDGEFVTDGLLGSLGEPMTWERYLHRYSANAEHLGSTSSFNRWQELFFTDLPEIIEGLGDEDDYFVDYDDDEVRIYCYSDDEDGDGYRESRTMKYSYKGELLETGFTYERTFLYEWFDGEYVAAMREAQLKHGFSDPE